LKLSALILSLAILAALPARAAKGIEIAGAKCEAPPVSHCPDANCGALVTEQGPVIEPKTNRHFFLDYPCDLKKNEKVTFILALHGAGSFGNWQRHYFPLLDFAKKYRLVIATPNAPPQVWAPTDDEYLQNIVTMVYDQIGAKNIKAFWLVGHSQGGMTSNRIVRSDFFKEKVDGFLSLSGGRIGGSPGRAAVFGPVPQNNANKEMAKAPAAPTTPRPNLSAAMAALREPPATDFSFIFETGQREMDDKGIPETSAWAQKLNCGARTKQPDVTDAKAGYVFDTRNQNPGNPSWGLLPRGGTAQVYEYPHCKDGRVVADVVRIDKGHTEGLEPNITETLIKLMLSAKPTKR
jgi:hypothetical protein